LQIIHQNKNERKRDKRISVVDVDLCTRRIDRHIEEKLIGRDRSREFLVRTKKDLAKEIISWLR